ncbi:MAG: flagellar biosynthesis anti-sigma factor FlgM [Spirochaetota bacterium]
MVIDKVGNINNVYETKKTKNVQKTGEIPSGNDSVSISTEGLRAVEEAKYSQIIKATPDIRAERVREIKEQIAAGTYDRDMDDKVLSMVADKILSNLLRK